MSIFGAAAGLIALASLAQAVRIGVLHHDWIAIKLLVGFVLLVLLWWLIASHVAIGD